MGIINGVPDVITERERQRKRVALLIRNYKCIVVRSFGRIVVDGFG